MDDMLTIMEKHVGLTSRSLVGITHGRQGGALDASVVVKAAQDGRCE